MAQWFVVALAASSSWRVASLSTTNNSNAKAAADAGGGRTDPRCVGRVVRDDAEFVVIGTSHAGRC